jgi:hypothetical protein
MSRVFELLLPLPNLMNSATSDFNLNTTSYNAQKSHGKSPESEVRVSTINLHLDNLTNSHTKKFLTLLGVANLEKHVPFPMHNGTHILDLVIVMLIADTYLQRNYAFSPDSPAEC